MREYYQLMDSDDDSMGIVYTDLPEEQLTPLWDKYYQESDDASVDDFIDEVLIPIDPQAHRLYLNQIYLSHD